MTGLPHLIESVGGVPAGAVSVVVAEGGLGRCRLCMCHVTQWQPQVSAARDVSTAGVDDHHHELAQFLPLWAAPHTSACI